MPVRPLRLPTVTLRITVILITLGFPPFPSSASWYDAAEMLLQRNQGCKPNETKYIVRWPAANGSLPDASLYQARIQELEKVKAGGFTTNDYIEERQQNNSPNTALKNLAVNKKVAALITNHKVSYDEKTARALFKQATNEGIELETAEELDAFHRIAADAKKKKAFFILKKMKEPATQEALLEAAVAVNEAGYAFETPAFETYLPVATVAVEMGVTNLSGPQIEATKKILDKKIHETLSHRFTSDNIIELATLTTETDQETSLTLLTLDLTPTKEGNRWALQQLQQAGIASPQPPLLRALASLSNRDHTPGFMAALNAGIEMPTANDAAAGQAFILNNTSAPSIDQINALATAIANEDEKAQERILKEASGVGLETETSSSPEEGHASSPLLIPSLSPEVPEKQEGAMQSPAHLHSTSPQTGVSPPLQSLARSPGTSSFSPLKATSPAKNTPRRFQGTQIFSLSPRKQALNLSPLRQSWGESSVLKEKLSSLKENLENFSYGEKKARSPLKPPIKGPSFKASILSSPITPSLELYAVEVHSDTPVDNLLEIVDSILGETRQSKKKSPFKTPSKTLSSPLERTLNPLGNPEELPGQEHIGGFPSSLGAQGSLGEADDQATVEVHDVFPAVSTASDGTEKPLNPLKAREITPPSGDKAEREEEKAVTSPPSPYKAAPSPEKITSPAASPARFSPSPSPSSATGDAISPFPIPLEFPALIPPQNGSQGSAFVQVLEETVLASFRHPPLSERKPTLLTSVMPTPFASPKGPIPLCQESRTMSEETDSETDEGLSSHLLLGTRSLSSSPSPKSIQRLADKTYSGEEQPLKKPWETPAGPPPTPSFKLENIWDFFPLPYGFDAASLVDIILYYLFR